MRDANINTPYRKAAFLATLVHESRLEYNIRGSATSTTDRPVSTSAST
jgi:predicted chitinase